MFNYNYTISTDFPNGRVGPDRLQQEVAASAISVPIDHIDTSGDTCLIWFPSALSGPDVAILDGIVATHSGNALFAPVVTIQLTKRTAAGVGLAPSQFSMPLRTAVLIEMEAIAKNTTNTKVATWKIVANAIRDAAAATVSATTTLISIKTDITWGDPTINGDIGDDSMVDFTMPTVVTDDVDWEVSITITPLMP